MEQQATDGVVSWQKPAERITGLLVVPGITFGLGVPLVIWKGGQYTAPAIVGVVVLALIQFVMPLVVTRSSPREGSRGSRDWSPRSR